MNSVRENPPGGVASYEVTINVGEYQSDPFVFCFTMDGTGTCADQDDPADPLTFTWDPSAIEGLEGGERKGALEEHAHSLFWDELNDQLGEDRVLQAEDFLGAELSFESGSCEELEEHIRRVLYLFPSIWTEEREELEVTICAATQEERAEVSEYCELMEDGDIDQEDREMIVPLICLGFIWNDPVGWSLEYNDGLSGRASGYYESACTVDYSIPRPSFHELAAAREELLRALRERDSGLEKQAREILGAES